MTRYYTTIVDDYGVETVTQIENESDELGETTEEFVAGLADVYKKYIYFYVEQPPPPPPPWVYKATHHHVEDGSDAMIVGPWPIEQSHEIALINEDGFAFNGTSRYWIPL